MNVELALQEKMYDEISELLSKADSMEKAAGYVAIYLRHKMAESVIDGFDYTIDDMGANGYCASITFTFTWNIGNQCGMIVYPKTSPAKAFDHAMGVI